MRSILSGALWLIAAVAIALGAAGIVPGMQRTSDDPRAAGRGDTTVHAHLDLAEGELRALAEDVDALGVQARGALAALVANDIEGAATALTAGDALIAEVRMGSVALGRTLEDVPLIDTPEGRYLVSSGPRERLDRLRSGLQATAALEGAWASLTLGSIAAGRLSSLLAEHDQAVLDAAEHGRAGRYDEARTALDAADAAIAGARTMRDQLARTVDVTTLDAWLDRNADYDVALRALYDAVAAAGGRVTPAVREAAEDEAAAKARLPGDSRGLVLIMAEVGQGGLNSAVIAIEQARGGLAAALSETPQATP